jgi:hypothetical protein
MKQRYINKLLTTALLGPAIAFAQKPQPAHPAELKLQPENENWYITGNKRISALTGYPAAVYNASFPVAHASPEMMARQYLVQNKATFGFSDADLQNLQLHAVRESATGYTVRLRQFWRGLPVNNNAEVTVHINRSDIVDFVMNGFRYGINLTNTNPAITPDAARQALVNRISISGNNHSEQTRLMVLRHNNTDHLVYRVVIATDRPVGEWEAYIDARSGALLKAEDVSAYHRHRSKPAPRWRAPMRLAATGTGNIFDPDPLSTANATYGGSYVDGTDANAAVLTAQLRSVTLQDITLNAGVYSLTGPYAVLQDFEAPNKGLFTQATSTFNFDRNADGFEAVNTYYHIDAAMRYLNVTLGLNIMPYQYTGGVRFDPSGLNGADNSHYLGSSGRLAFGEGGVDDAEDADVIIHELGHGLHDWVTSGGLSQVNGLSEGCGDYFAGSYSRAKGNWTSAQAAYHWTFNWDGHNPFWGGRVLNYGAVYPGGLVSQIHTDGQIWATAMMKIWDDIGRQKADRVFWSGIDLTNGSSNQNDAANAVYTAAGTLGFTNAERFAIHSRLTAAGYTLPGFVIVPVALSGFTARKSGTQAQLNWSTASETQSKTFTVERSVNGRAFVAIGTIAAAGNSQQSRAYAFTDATPMPGTNYYRIKQTSIDGHTQYTQVEALSFDTKLKLRIYPNPASTHIILNYHFEEASAALYNNDGKLVRSIALGSSANGPVRIGLDGLPAGNYWLRLTADGQVLEGRVMKTR